MIELPLYFRSAYIYLFRDRTSLIVRLAIKKVPYTLQII